MKSKTFRISAILALALLVLVLGTAVAAAIAKSNLAKKYPAPGQLVDVGGYRLHLNCVGQGSPKVILEAGMGDSSLKWAYVQPEIAKNTRVCSYDRAGYGWSDTSPNPRTASNEVEELHKLLINANIQGPYVLVGHSLGGLLIRMYTHNYPDDVLGLVLVDSMHEDVVIREPEAVVAVQEMADQYWLDAFLSSSGIMALAPQNVPNPGLPEAAYAQYQATTVINRGFETYMAESDAMDESSAEARALNLTSFGDLPLIVLSAGHAQSIPSYTEAENQHLWETLQDLQSELPLLSSQGKQILAEQSGHYIQLDQPDLVIDAIREMLAALRQ